MYVVVDGRASSVGASEQVCLASKIDLFLPIWLPLVGLNGAFTLCGVIKLFHIENSKTNYYPVQMRYNKLNKQ